MLGSHSAEVSPPAPLLHYGSAMGGRAGLIRIHQAFSLSLAALTALCLGDSPLQCHQSPSCFTIRLELYLAPLSQEVQCHEWFLRAFLLPWLFHCRLQVPEATFVADQNAAQERQFSTDWKERAHESKQRFSFHKNLIPSSL